MDLFSEELQGDAFWYEPTPLNQSAFLPYTSTPTTEISASNSGNRSNPTNMNKRIIEFMTISWPVRTETQESESARCFRRKISERVRREKEKNGYLALHAMLPLGTKNDKNSIMQVAAKRIHELKRYKEVLKRRNQELEAKSEAMEVEYARSTKIEFKVRNASSGVDYMVEVLKCLNSLGAKIRSIKSTFSDEELVAVMDIETQISDAEVRKAVQSTLKDVGRKLLGHFAEGSMQHNV
ncbi:hypothetical protein P3X46_027572 [Hevea brasiliensis]|uniref:BHLH domain-containing protein n=1 Tax=Hevea brasiliensis TaxID=3981 RepID=A0ABQ9L1Z0_HEVBR|nr:transcription factor bHLH92 isoform X1 [Hevea brasiliensis]KAJ9154213.1 hypothetical protein P3X46_027572 [Hevea brasiliensis]